MTYRSPPHILQSYTFSKMFLTYTTCIVNCNRIHWAMAGLLANSGCFVSKCVLWCFVVFCGCFSNCDVFCGCFAVFCECFAVFPQNTQNTRKTSNNTGKHKKLTIRSCIAGVFEEPKISTVLRKTPFTKHLQNTAKHRKQQSQNAFCEITSQNTAKRTQNARKSKTSQNAHNTAAIHIARAFGVFSQNTLDLSRKHTQYAIYAYITEGDSRTHRGSRSRIVDVFQKQCFAVFCGVLWCFAVFYVRVFSVFHKTAQNRPKSIQNAQNEQNKNTLCAISAIRCCASFSHSENVCKKHSQNTSKTLQTSAKHRKTLFFKKQLQLQNTTKHPQNTAKHRKTPQNTTKHIC